MSVAGVEALSQYVCFPQLSEGYWHAEGGSRYCPGPQHVHEVPPAFHADVQGTGIDGANARLQGRNGGQEQHTSGKQRPGTGRNVWCSLCIRCISGHSSARRLSRVMVHALAVWGSRCGSAAETYNWKAVQVVEELLIYWSHWFLHMHHIFDD